MKIKFYLPILVLLYAFSFDSPKIMAANQEDVENLVLEQDSIAIPTTLPEENGVIVIEPLFEYPQAPEDLPDLQSRTDYLMDNFWKPFDFKNNKSVDQIALNDAFAVYALAMPYASEKKVRESVRNLIGKIKNNPGLSYQFAKAAEENIYGPRAKFWADDIYMDFLQNLIDNKKIAASKKKRYAEQLKLLRSTALGTPLPAFNLETQEGTVTKFYPKKKFTLIGFTPAGCDDCRYSAVKLDISGIIRDLLEDNELEVMIVFDEVPSKNIAFPDKWTVLFSDNANEVMDLRRQPSFYVLNKEGKIAGKNLTVDDAIDLLSVLSSNK